MLVSTGLAPTGHLPAARGPAQARTPDRSWAGLTIGGCTINTGRCMSSLAMAMGLSSYAVTGGDKDRPFGRRPGERMLTDGCPRRAPRHLPPEGVFPWRGRLLRPER